MDRSRSVPLEEGPVPSLASCGKRAATFGKPEESQGGPRLERASARRPAFSPPTEVERNPTKAEQLSREAADLVPDDLAEAERLLREALTADLFHGPAHNNLGVVFLKQEKLYEAAQEFEWAKKLMPGHPDPRVNLALVMEMPGRTEDALGAYASALEVRSEYVPAVQGMARLMVRAGRDDAGAELVRGR